MKNKITGLIGTIGSDPPNLILVIAIRRPQAQEEGGVLLCWEMEQRAEMPILI